MSMNLKNIAILNIKSTEYSCIISGISKGEDINLIKILAWPKKSGTV